jgi:hypothetical protein
MRVLLLKTWLVNIGNGFIDAGAEAAIRNAVPEAEIVDVSGYSNHVGDVVQEFGGLSQKLTGSGSESSTDFRDRFVNVADLVDADVAVLPGCVLFEHALRKYLPVLRRLEQRNTPIVFLGAGGGDYERSTVEYVERIANEITLAGIITRDSTAYTQYEHLAPSYDGIDCAFWIDEYYSPPETTTQFTNLTFDKIDEPEVDTGEDRVIRPDHSPFEHPWEYPVKDVAQKVVSPDPRFDQENIFMSDAIEDYLFLYANANETHTDRIHAALPTIVYGNTARFYYETPRADLFDRVLATDITNDTVTLNREMLIEERSKQESELATILESTVDR